MVFIAETSARPVTIVLVSTQTKIKNYFYGNIRFLLKIIIKEVLHVKAGSINDIKTDILLDIYQGKNSKPLPTKNFKDSISSKRPSRP